MATEKEDKKKKKKQGLGRKTVPVAFMLNRKTSRKIMAAEIAGDVEMNVNRLKGGRVGHGGNNNIDTGNLRKLHTCSSVSNEIFMGLWGKNSSGELILLKYSQPQM